MPDPLDELPGMRAFGDALHSAALRDDGTTARRRLPGSVRGGALAAAMLLGVTGTTATATVIALRATAITAPDPSVVPASQTPRADGETLLGLRARDPTGQDPWALRRSVGETGLTCTTVGQVRHGVFGIVGTDGVFRAIPSSVTDACGQEVLLGARVVAGAPVRSVVAGIAGTGTRAVELRTSSGARRLPLGPNGSFLVTVRGNPEDQALEVAITNAAGVTTVRSAGRQPSLVPDLDGAPAWRMERLVLGTRALCNHLRDARQNNPGGFSVKKDQAFPWSSTPSACLDPRQQDVSVVADARRFAPGQQGVPGFDRWAWRARPARTVLWGITRYPGLVTALELRGAPGRPRPVTVASNGTFAVILPRSVDPKTLSLVVRLANGKRRTVIPGRGLVPDLVPARRPR